MSRYYFHGICQYKVLSIKSYFRVQSVESERISNMQNLGNVLAKLLSNQYNVKVHSLQSVCSTMQSLLSPHVRCDLWEASALSNPNLGPLFCGLSSAVRMPVTHMSQIANTLGLMSTEYRAGVKYSDRHLIHIDSRVLTISERVSPNTPACALAGKSV